MYYNDKDNSYIEIERLYDEDYEDNIIEPFDPKDVDIINQTMVISNIVDRLKYDEIELTPDFQRFPGLWNDEKQSRLIESLIIKIPLPSFYFDHCDDDKLIVVDGQQRLFALKRFMSLDKEDSNRLRLRNLEYLKEYDGLIFEELPIQIQRRIREQNINVYIIRSGTPSKVRTSIFQRINTGGLTLTSAEIRNSVYRGQAAFLLKKLAHSPEFVAATNSKISPLRMEDCEFVNRILAFYLLGIEAYNENLEKFLEDTLEYIQKATFDVVNKCEKVFIRAMSYAHKIFGKNAFRRISSNGKYGKINKPLFEAVSVNFALLNETECRRLLEHKDQFLLLYIELLNDKEFSKRISEATGKKENVRYRHEKVKDIIERTLAND